MSAWYDYLISSVAAVHRLRKEVAESQTHLDLVRQYDRPELVAAARKDLSKKKRDLKLKEERARAAFQREMEKQVTPWPAPKIYPPGKCPYCGGQPGERAGYALTECCHRPIDAYYHDGQLVGYGMTSTYD